MSKRIIVGTVLSMATVFSLLWFFWPSEEDRIRKQFDELSDLALNLDVFLLQSDCDKPLSNPLCCVSE